MSQPRRAQTKQTRPSTTPPRRNATVGSNAPAFVQPAVDALQARSAREVFAAIASTRDASWLDAPARRAERARLQTHVWVLGAGASTNPDFGEWLVRSEVTFASLVLDPARRTLRDRVLAARAIAVAADAVALAVPPASRVSTLMGVVRYLLNHPEPLVWIPIARSLGRLALRIPLARALMSEARSSQNLGSRRRGLTAVASMPADAFTEVRDVVSRAIDPKASEPLSTAAVALAIPTLATEHPAAWLDLVTYLESDSCPLDVTWSAAQGMWSLRQRGPLDRVSERVAEALRARAAAPKIKAVTEGLQWAQIRAIGPQLSASPDKPADIELMLERLVLGATEGDRDKNAALALRLRDRVVEGFVTSLAAAPTAGEPERAGEQLRLAESCARSIALGLWDLLGAAAGAPATPPLDVAPMLAAIGEALGRPKLEFGLARTALRAIGASMDRTDTPARDERSSARGHAAADACGLVEAALALKGTAKAHEKAVADVMWRVLDATRPAVAAFQDVGIVRRFAVWWALAASKTELLKLLERSDTSVSPGGISSLLASVEAVRAAMHTSRAGADAGAWAPTVGVVLQGLGLGDCALSRGLQLLADAQRSATAIAAGAPPDVVDEWTRELGDVTELLRAALANPELALSSCADDLLASASRRLDDETAAALLSGGPLAAALLAQWTDGLGPVVGPLVVATLRLVADALAKAKPAARLARAIDRYERVELLGRGGQGEAWLVRDRSIGRLFVMKVPLGAFDAGPTATVPGLSSTLAREARFLRAFHHANVAKLANFDFDGPVPFVVIDYLVGVDLESYVQARPLGLAESAPLVADMCSALAALHAQQLVHRDLKPANVYLQLDLHHGGSGSDGASKAFRFEPARHRDPRAVRVTSAVLIDLGIARGFGDPNAAASFEGSLHFLAPEQARRKAPTPASDVYALAATVYYALTGRRFFEELPTAIAVVHAHASRSPFDDAQTARGLPDGVLSLLKAASDLDPHARVTVPEFAARFAALAR